MILTTESIHSQFQSFLQARKNFYQMLHLMFSGPNQGEYWFELQNIRKVEGLDEIHEGGKLLRLFFDQLTVVQILKEQEEYQRLFIGPGPLIAPPWESYYRSKEQLLFDKYNYQIRKLFHHFGLQNRKENKEPDDHVLLELEFMIYLIDFCMEKDNIDKVMELVNYQIHLLENHITIWIPFFCRRIIENTNSQLYLGAALLLEDFISFDLQSLIELKEVLT